MAGRYDYGGLSASIGRTGEMISQHVMRMPQIRHQLQMEAMTAAQRNQLNQAQQETERAQAENYRASSRKGNAEAALTEDELKAAGEIQSVFSEPDAAVTNANGSLTFSPKASQALAGLMFRAGNRGSAGGAGLRNFMTARNAPFEAEANRVATGERNTYSVDQREQTRREAPIVLRDDARLVTPAGEQLGGLGLHKLNPDQTLVGDVPGVELNRMGTGVPKPTTPQGDSNRQRFRSAIIMKKASGEMTPEQAATAMAEYEGGATGQVPGVRQAAAPGYKIGARYKGGLVYLGGDPTDQNSWQRD